MQVDKFKLTTTKRIIIKIRNTHLLLMAKLKVR